MLNRREMLVQGGLAAGLALSAVPSKLAWAQSSGLKCISLTLPNGFTYDALSAGPADGPLAICLHGFPELMEGWTQVLTLLGAQGFHAVAVNQRGYSPRARPADMGTQGAYTEDNLVSDVLGFATALNAPQFHLLAHDWGATIAWRCAVQHPERVLSLTALSTPHPDAYIAALQVDNGDQPVKSMYLVTLGAPYPSGENFMLSPGVLTGTYNGVLPQSELNFYLAQFQQPALLTPALNWYREMDLQTLIGPCTVPALYLLGTNDAYNGPTAAAMTASLCTGLYEFVQLPGLSHWLLEQAPGTIVSLFLEQISLLQ